MISARFYFISDLTAFAFVIVLKKNRLPKKESGFLNSASLSCATGNSNSFSIHPFRIIRCKKHCHLCYIIGLTNST